jgi:hypothetical protein
MGKAFVSQIPDNTFFINAMLKIDASTTLQVLDTSFMNIKNKIQSKRLILHQ